MSIKTCEQVLQEIYQYLDDDMDQKNMPEFKQHLDLCRSCLSVVVFERLLREHMRTRTNHMCPESLKQKIKSIVEQF